MANTIREQIIQKIITRAAVITTGNGYNTDIGGNVNRVIEAIDPDGLPALAVWPLPETNTRQYGLDNMEMQVRLEGLVAHGATNPSVVSELILGDLRQAFTDPSIKAAAYGALIDDLYYVAGGTDTYAKTGDLTTGCNIILMVKYNTLIGNPYSQ